MSWAIDKFKLYHIAFCLMLVFLQTAFTKAQVEMPKIDENLDVNAKVKVESEEEVMVVAQNSILETNDLIHFGDLIDVDILGSTEFDWRGKITNEGYLDGIEFTKNEVYGLCQTGDQVAKEIKKSYEKFLKNPDIVVTILDRSNRPISTLFGAVKLPQKFIIKRKVYLNELIILAGGFTENASGNIQILRQNEASCIAKKEKELAKNKENQTEEFVKVSQDNGTNFVNIKISDLLSGQVDANLQILYGDIVTVQTAEPIYVIGGVVNPVKISVREKINVTRAIATAGGLTKNADPQKITVFRRENGKTKVIKINLNDISDQKTDDIELRAYDIVDVSENGRDEKKYPPIIRTTDIDNDINFDLPLTVID